MDKQIHCFFGLVGYVDLHRSHILLYLSWILLTAWGSDLPFVILAVLPCWEFLSIWKDTLPLPWPRASAVIWNGSALLGTTRGWWGCWRSEKPHLVQPQATLLWPGRCPGPRLEEASRSFCLSLFVQVSFTWNLSSPSRLSWGRIEMGPWKAHGVNLENTLMHPAFSMSSSEWRTQLKEVHLIIEKMRQEPCKQIFIHQCAPCSSPKNLVMWLC